MNKLTLTEPEFSCIAELIRARDPARSAAYMVLVEGASNQAAMEARGVSPASLSNTLGRYRKAVGEIRTAFPNGVPETKNLTSPQFYCIADLIRARDPAKSAAYRVLVEGNSNQETMESTGISPASLSNTLTRYRKAAADIANAF